MKEQCRIPVLFFCITTLFIIVSCGDAGKGTGGKLNGGVGKVILHPENPQNLVDAHVAEGQDCLACHDSETGATEDNLVVENKKCVNCHGSLEELADVGVKNGVAVHSSHLIGDIACTSCHKGHQASTSYCAACHSFQHEIAYGKKWLPEKVDIAKDKAEQDAALAAGPRERTDIIVIGSGGAGLAAAVAAREQGASVILLEKEPIAGGNTKLAAGGMNAAETNSQTMRGIEDHVQTMIDDTMKGGRNKNNPALVKILAENSASSVDWLTAMGADLTDVGRMGGASVNRSHRPTGGAGVGAHVAQVLWDRAKKLGVNVRFNSKAVRLVKDEAGDVIGVLVHGKISGYYTLGANAVVMATGGFSRNNALVSQYDPKLQGFKSTNHPGAIGDGLKMAEEAGAATKDLQYIQAHPTYSPVGGVMVTEAVRGNGAILVNREGKRFVNEITTRDKAAAAILSQKGGSAFLVFDDSIRKSLKKIESYINLGFVLESETLSGLAEKAGMNGDLEATIVGYNDFQKAGKDDAFNRPDLPRPVMTPPFYAIEVTPAVHHTMGGMTIDARTRVKDTDGRTINGLYAAGEATGGIHGANRLGGNAISDIVTFGRIAGKEAAKRASAL